MTWLIVFCSLLFVLGLAVGARLGVWLADRDWRGEAEVREEEAAAEWWGRVREPGRAIAYRPQHARRTSTAAFLAPPPGPASMSTGLWQITGPPEVAHEWGVHVGQALALARPETDAEFGARMAAAADEIIAWARAALAPYPGSDQ